MNQQTNLKTLLVMVILLSGYYTSAAGNIIYVDANADGANNGTSWNDAYIYLQDALCDPNLFGPVQIWVAEGTYKPDRGGGISWL